MWDIFLYFPFLRVLTIVLSGCDLSRTTGIIIVLKYKKTNNGLIAIAIGIANISCYHDSTTIIKITQHRRFATRSGLNTRQHSSNNLRITLKTIKLVISSSHLAQHPSRLSSKNVDMENSNSNGDLWDWLDHTPPLITTTIHSNLYRGGLDLDMRKNEF